MGCTCREDPDVVDICESDNPCKNGAECVSQGRKANCICTKGFSGETCNLVDAKWQEWSSCAGICGPEGTRTRKCTRASTMGLGGRFSFPFPFHFLPPFLSPSSPSLPYPIPLAIRLERPALPLEERLEIRG